MRSLIIVLLAVAVEMATPAAGQGIDPVEPVVLGGAAYYPSGPTVFFDGAVMVRAGSYKGVSVYVDPTRDPYNVVYVPMANKLMRPYERPAADRTADTIVPPPPSAPVETELLEPDIAVKEAPADYAPAPAQSRSPASYTASSRAGDNRGFWIAFDGRVWVLAERQPIVARDLVPSGNYYGFPVYRHRSNRKEIFVSSGTTGFLARYTLEESR
jgi:hypothetical protein